MQSGFRTTAALFAAVTLFISAAATGKGEESQPGTVQAAPESNPEYVLGPGDEVSIWVLGLDELSNQTFRIDPSGHIDLPLLGKVRADGLTTPMLKQTVARLSQPYVVHSEVTVHIREYRSQSVSVLGAVNKPGVVQLRGRKTLMEVLSSVEGLRPDAGNRITITRKVQFGRPDVAGAALDSSGEFFSADLRTADLLSGRNPKSNILVQPNDVITVGRASTVYVIGEVKKSGGFLLTDRDHVTVLEAVSLAEGVTRMAQAKKVHILRRPAGGSGDKRVGIPVNLQRILDGEAPDHDLLPEDIVFVPDNRAKHALTRALETTVNVASGITIWRVGLPR